MELCLDAGSAQAQSVGEVLVAEDVQLSNLDVGRRQLGRIGDSRGCGGGGYVRATGRVPQQSAPAGDVVVVLLYDVPDDVRIDGGGAVVQHRIDEDLPGDGRAGVVAGHDRHGGGQAAAGALAHHCDPRPVDAELFGVLVHPPQSGVGILNLRRIAVLGSQPVATDSIGVPLADTYPARNLSDRSMLPPIMPPPCVYSTAEPGAQPFLAYQRIGICAPSGAVA